MLLLLLSQPIIRGVLIRIVTIDVKKHIGSTVNIESVSFIRTITCLETTIKEKTERNYLTVDTFLENTITLETGIT